MFYITIRYTSIGDTMKSILTMNQQIKYREDSKNRMRIKRAEDKMKLEDYIDLEASCTVCTPECAGFYDLESICQLKVSQS